MKIRKISMLVLGLAAPLAQASIQVENMSCSGSLALNDHNGISFDCGGDLSLSGGNISVENGSLHIKAAGNLSLDSIWLKALNVELNGDNIHIADNVNIEIIGVTDNSGSVDFNLPTNIRSESGVTARATELSWGVLLKAGADISGAVTTSWGDKPPLNADAGIRLVGGDIIIPEATRVTGSDIEVQFPSGVIVAQNGPASVPLPTASFNVLLGLTFWLVPALRRKFFSA